MLGWAPHGDHGVDVSHIQDDGSAFMWWYHFCHELRPVKIEEPPCQLAWSVLVPSANHAMCGIVWGGNYPILLHTNTVELLFCSGLGAKVVAIKILTIWLNADAVVGSVYGGLWLPRM
jgi:hypothetical protein